MTKWDISTYGRDRREEIAMLWNTKVLLLTERDVGDKALVMVSVLQFFTTEEFSIYERGRRWY